MMKHSKTLLSWQRDRRRCKVAQIEGLASQDDFGNINLVVGIIQAEVVEFDTVWPCTVRAHEMLMEWEAEDAS